MTYSIQYGNKQIEFNLKYVDRKTLQINVFPDLAVEVKAPCNAPMDKVLAKVKKRAAWITKQQHYFNQFLPLQPPRRFISGETHRYLGRQYRLKVIKSDKSKVKMSGGFINVYLCNPTDANAVRCLVTAWYRDHAEAIFSEVMKNCQTVLSRLEIYEMPEIKIRFMKTRWGSCTRNGRITLNSELIKAPKSCINYVIIHELCHLQEHHHSKSFYNLLDKCLSGWKVQKNKLNQMADLIL